MYKDMLLHLGVNAVQWPSLMEGTRYDGSPIQSHSRRLSVAAASETPAERQRCQAPSRVASRFASFHVSLQLQGTPQVDGREHQGIAVAARMRFSQGEGFAIVGHRAAQVS